MYTCMYSNEYFSLPGREFVKGEKTVHEILERVYFPFKRLRLEENDVGKRVNRFQSTVK